MRADMKEKQRVIILKLEKAFLICLLTASCLATAVINAAVFTVESYVEIPAALISVRATDAAADYGAQNLLDGDSATIWHTSWQPAPAALPQSLIFDFTEAVKLSSISVLPRQDMDNGRISLFNLYVKKPSGEFEAVVESGEWSYTDNIDYKTAIIDPPVEAASLKLEVLYGLNGFVSAAEVKFTGVLTGRVLTAETEQETVSEISYDSVGSIGIYADDEHPRYPGTHVIDNDPDTIWHTDWETGDGIFPHRLYIDLGGEYTITGIRFMDRQDGSQNGSIIKCILYSDSGQETGAVEPTAPNRQAREIPLKRHIKTNVLIIEVTEGYGDFASMAELSVQTEESGVITSWDAFH